MITEEQIREALKVVVDPEINVDIVNLGLLYDVRIINSEIKIQMTLTSPGCPVAPQIIKQAKEILMQIEGITNIDIEIVWDPPWNPEMMSDDARDQLGIF